MAPLASPKTLMSHTCSSVPPQTSIMRQYGPWGAMTLPAMPGALCQSFRRGRSDDEGSQGMFKLGKALLSG